MAQRVDGVSEMMWAFLLIALLGVTEISAAELIITHAPKYLTFVKEADNLQTSEIAAVIASAFGIPLTKDLQWNGLHAGSIFHRPKAGVLVSIEGHEQPLEMKSLARYQTIVDNPFVDMGPLSIKIRGMDSAVKPMTVDFSVDNTIFDVKSQYPQLFKHLPTTYGKVRETFVNGEAFTPAEVGSLNYTKDIDLRYLGELHLMRQILESLQQHKERTKGTAPDLYHFKVTGLERLASEYGTDSSKYSDAVVLLELVVQEVTNEFRTLYKDNVIIEVVTLPSPKLQGKMRHTRSLKEAATDNRTQFEKAINYADDYDPLFPVIFNIILWTSIILGVALLLISWDLWNMDPGRDSIIYRMTSQRMKKE